MHVRLWDYLKKYTLRFLAAVIFSVCACGLAALGPQLLGRITTEIFDGIMAKLNGTGSMDFAAVAQILKLLAALYLLSAALLSAAGWLMSWVSADLAFRLREDTAKKVSVLPLPYLEEWSVGDMLSCMTADVDVLECIGQSVSQLLCGLSSGIGIAVMMLRISVPLTVILVFIILTAGILILLLARKAKKYKNRRQEAAAEAKGYVEELYSERDLIKAFGREKAALSKYRGYNEQLYESSWRAELYTDLMNVVMQSAGSIGYVFTVLFGGMFAFRGQIAVGDIQAFLHYIRNIGQPVRQVSQSAGMLQSAAAAWKRIQAVLEAEEERDTVYSGSAPEGEEAGIVNPDSLAEHEKTVNTSIGDLLGQYGAVRFEHVTFGYKAQTPVLTDFTADILPGQKVAVTGCTGIGKTTMVKLLMRFYDVLEGSIYVDGVDVRAYDRAQLRSKFGIVLQEAWLFRGTVLDNIRYGRMEASREEAERAARAAGADDFIKRLPQGYDTVICEETCSLSQGEKQQLTIARAILADPEILILDEATSSVDTLTEQKIQRALDREMQGKTCFIIAHRPQTIRGADLVLHIGSGT